MFLNKQDVERINSFANQKKSFLFIIDYACRNIHLLTSAQANSEQIYFSVPGFSNLKPGAGMRNGFRFRSSPPGYHEYLQSFKQVHKQLSFGNSFLLNLTCRIPVDTDLSLSEIFERSHAPYKLLFKDQFVVFSPETFIRVRDNKIFACPMKGTIDASEKNAREQILGDKKETAEHATIVDLIRNDLSRVAENVRVTDFRYTTEIQTNRKKLIQVSSEICGELAYEFPGQLGNILGELLPAGSISGAPKKKTCEIIDETENGPRGYYTGVFGYFDGQSLDSAVMIRFIEMDKNKKYYRAGGGITVYSDPESEYREIIDKVYVPFI